ncbi:hypothetical protein V1283_003342 [Bradyrhizobium sp. AZCC 2262]|uniref:hypothetical protein n=1 Tax=Bradyrhizobium sp. AZCC 2262 TaxID=3117022 RepID=UPI002FF02FC2
MGGLRVVAADLRLTAPEYMRSGADDLQRDAAETFLPAVLAVAERRLVARFGGEAVIRLPQLDLQLRLKPGELLTDATIEAVGSDIAEAIASRVTAASEATATGAPSGIVYRSASEREACAIAAAARGQAPPAGEQQDFSALWGTFERRQPEQQAKLLVQLSEIKALHPVLARLSRAGLAMLLRRVRMAVPSTVRQELTRAAAAKGIAAEAGPSREAPIGPPPKVDGAIPRAETPSGRQAVFAGKPGASATARPQAVQPGEAARESRSVTSMPQDGRSDDVVKADAPHAARIAPASTSLEHRPAMTQPTSLARAAVAGPPTQAVIAEGEPYDVAIYESQWCALLGLINLSMACELAERLWRIGVDESGVLAAMFARLSGTADDPASRVLGRAFPDITSCATELPEWAERELVDGTIAEAIRLTGNGAIALRINELASHYRSGAGFDLAAWGAGLHLALAETRLGEQLTPAAVTARFARPGQIVVGRDVIQVIQPMGAVDLELRRAGLDLNPGWLAWLAKRLEFVFEEQDEAP